MSHTYLLEIGCEEIPARFMATFLNELKEKTEAALDDHRLVYKSVNTIGTYRRLAIQISGLEKKQADNTQFHKGPPKRIAYDDNGNALPPALGFAKKFGATEKDLTTMTEKGQDYVGLSVHTKGQSTKSILSEMMLGVVGSLSLPIAMKWGDHQDVFFRPVHWVVSLLDDKVLALGIHNAKAGRITHGHRFLTQNSKKGHIASGAPVSISKAGDYEKELKKAKVLVDQTARKAMIKDALKKTLAVADIDENLLEEVTHLVEWPTVLEGSFDKNYLKIPESALIQCMKKHQKYFPILKSGKLSPGFIVVADSVTAKNKKNILSGNENVLLARLEDVRFFWEEDLKQRLDEFLPKLKQVVFQKGLGSLADKIDRMQKLATVISKSWGYDIYLADISRAVALAKADLVSLMVNELPALQGEIGALYAQKQGEKKAVVTGIREHYQPKFSGDSIPSTPTGRVTAIADKMDTVVACFVNNLIPTGSQDPLAVRRSVYGIIRIILESKLTMDLAPIIDAAFKNFNSTKNRDKLDHFLSQRMVTYFQDQGAVYDTVEAVLAAHPTHITVAGDYIQAIDAFRKKAPAKFKGIVDTAVRVKRLAAKAEKKAGKIDTKRFEIKVEKDANAALDKLIKKSIKIADLDTLTPIMETYFDDVLVMAKDKAVKNNRLNFLSQLNEIYAHFADFEKFAI